VKRALERGDLAAVTRAADRMDAMADIADLMGDVDGAIMWHARASNLRLDALHLIDDGTARGRA
jgi:hypothetical protein